MEKLQEAQIANSTATSTITPRQAQIKQMAEEGFSAVEMGEQLNISRNAVYQHIEALRKRGELPSDYTPSGAPPRSLSEQQSHPSGSLAQLFEELDQVRLDLHKITKRLDTLLS